MPIMDGYEATKEYPRRQKPDASDIPILAVTANAMAKDIVKVHEAGMNERITKVYTERAVVSDNGKIYSVRKGRSTLRVPAFYAIGNV